MYHMFTDLSPYAMAPPFFTFFFFHFLRNVADTQFFFLFLHIYSNECKTFHYVENSSWKMMILGLRSFFSFKSIPFDLCVKCFTKPISVFLNKCFSHKSTSFQLFVMKCENRQKYSTQHTLTMIIVFIKTENICALRYSNSMISNESCSTRKTYVQMRRK